MQRPLERRAERVVHLELAAVLGLVEPVEAAEARRGEHRPEPQGAAHRGRLLRADPSRRRCERRPLEVQAPRVVAAGPPRAWRHLEPPTLQLDPARRGAALRVAGLVGGAPAAGRGEVMGLLVGGRRGQPAQVEPQVRGVLVEGEVDLAERLDEVVPVRADVGVAVGPPRPLEAHGVLDAVEHHAGVAADHVVVRVHPHALEQEDALVGREHPEVVAVVERVVRHGHDAERVRRLVDRELVVTGEHGHASWPAAAWPAKAHRLSAVAGSAEVGGATGVARGRSRRRR